MSIDRVLQQKIDDLKDKNLQRNLKGEWSGSFVNFTTNDYLGLSGRQEVIVAGIKAAEKYGAGAKASRLAGGNHPLYEQLEDELAKHKGTAAALVFGSGYLANIGVIPALMGKGDLIIADKLSHSCLIEAAQNSGAEFLRFKHNDLKHLQQLLAKRKSYKNCLVVTEEIFSMDGDAAPLKNLRQLADKFKCWLLVDGAHSLYAPAKNYADIYIGTLSKAVGCYGGYVVGSITLIEFLKSKAKTLIYSTGLPPFVVGAAIKSLAIIKSEKPYLKAMRNAEYFCAKLGKEKPQSNIIPLILDEEKKALAAEKYLKSKKILVSAIRPPTVPPQTSRLRISITAAHTKSQIDLLAESLKTMIL